MYILAIETTGAFASVALAKASDPAGISAKALDSAGISAKAPDPAGISAKAPALNNAGDFEILAQVEGNDRYSHLQNLTPQIEEVIRMAGDITAARECTAAGESTAERESKSTSQTGKSKLSIDDMSAIAVSNGPGSFTGIRIGVSTGRALSQVKGIPCVAVPSLEALAMHAGGSCSESAGPLTKTLICSILDARRSQVYGGGYILNEEGFPDEIIKAGPYTVDEFIQKLDNVETDSGKFSKILFTGDGVDKYGDIIKEHYSELFAAGIIRFADEEVRYQDAQTVAKLGWKLLQEGKGCAFEQLKPEYMRMAEAERKLKEKK